MAGDPAVRFVTAAAGQVTDVLAVLGEAAPRLRERGVAPWPDP